MKHALILLEGIHQHHQTVHICVLLSKTAVYNHWTGLVDWTGGLTL